MAEESKQSTDEEETGISRRDVMKIGVFTAAGAAVGGALGFFGGSGSRQQEIDSLNGRLQAISRIVNLPPLSQTVSMLNWSLYTNYALLDGFVDEFKVQMDYSESAETEDDFRAQLKADNPIGYDIMIVTGYAVQEAIQAGKLQKLNKDYIPNVRNIDPSFNTWYDPAHDYALPYLWGTTGIGWNQNLVQFPTGQTTVNSWAQIFDDSAGSFLKRNSGKVTVIGDRDEALTAAAIYLGHDVNDLSDATLQDLKNLLIGIKPDLAMFADATQYYDGLGNNQFAASHAWSGDVLFIRADFAKPEITYTIPNEGANLWTDNYVIPVNAPHKDTAEVFINYMWEASNAAVLAMFRNYMIANKLSLHGGALDTDRGGSAGMIIPYVLSLPDIDPLTSRPDLEGKLVSLRARTEAENLKLNQIWDEIQAA